MYSPPFYILRKTENITGLLHKTDAFKNNNSSKIGVKQCNDFLGCSAIGCLGAG
jgi:hypothetical protein